MGVAFAPGEVKNLDAQLTPHSIEAGKYTAGVLYLYPEGYEGDPDPDTWRDDWYDYTLEIARFHLDRWEDFIRHHELFANVSISFVDKQSVDAEPNEGVHWTKMHGAYTSYPGWDSTDLRIGYFAYNVNSPGFSLDWAQLVCAKTGVDYWGMKFMKGEYWPEVGPDYRYCRSQLSHELGHLFGVMPSSPHTDNSGHCYSPEATCLMSRALNNISYNEWIARGQILWFCDDCRDVILNSWADGKFL